MLKNNPERIKELETALQSHDTAIKFIRPDYIKLTKKRLEFIRQISTHKNRIMVLKAELETLQEIE